MVDDRKPVAPFFPFPALLGAGESWPLCSGPLRSLEHRGAIADKTVAGQVQAALLPWGHRLHVSERGLSHPSCL